jgi:hypothetical protein
MGCWIPVKDVVRAGTRFFVALELEGDRPARDYS